MVQLPANPGRLILNNIAVRTAPLLRVDDFVKYCNERSLGVPRARLRRFEQLRLVVPIVRVRAAAEGEEAVWLNSDGVDRHFESGRVIDVSAVAAEYDLPADDVDWMPYYSRFQFLEVARTLDSLDVTVPLDQYLEPNGEVQIPQAMTDWWTRQVSWDLGATETREADRALAVLAQFISNRYQPHTQSNRRTMTVSPTSTFTKWLAVESMAWKWWEYASDWDPHVTIEPFDLDRESLRSAYWKIATHLRSQDPLWDWNDLVAFVDRKKRDRLKGEALLGQAYRDLAKMLRLLYKDLYDEDLPEPHEIGLPAEGQIPEIDVRVDPREHLKYVANLYTLNPQPKLVLFVEGESEVRFVEQVYPELFGSHYGFSGIKLVNLHGVGNATGRKREDRFNALFRLIDYLHDEQIDTLVILDNEGHAQHLKDAARKKASLFGQRARATTPSRIRVWKTNFEFDNFSDTELARALTSLAPDDVRFRSQDVKHVRENWPKEGLSSLFKERTERGLEKPALAEQLAKITVAEDTRRSPMNRPIVKVLVSVHEEASRNWLPVRRDIWEANQQFFG